MERRPRDDERFADWVDGRLSDDDRAAFAAEIERDPELAERLAEYAATIDLVRDSTLEDRVLEDRAPANLVDSVMASLEPAMGRRSWRVWGSTLAAAAAVVVGAVGLWRGFDSGPEVRTAARSGEALWVADTDSRRESAVVNPDPAGEVATSSVTPALTQTAAPDGAVRGADETVKVLRVLRAKTEAEEQNGVGALRFQRADEALRRDLAKVEKLVESARKAGGAEPRAAKKSDEAKPDDERVDERGRASRKRAIVAPPGTDRSGAARGGRGGGGRALAEPEPAREGLATQTFVGGELVDLLLEQRARSLDGPTDGIVMLTLPGAAAEHEAVKVPPRSPRGGGVRQREEAKDDATQDDKENDKAVVLFGEATGLQVEEFGAFAQAPVAFAQAWATAGSTVFDNSMQPYAVALGLMPTDRVFSVTGAPPQLSLYFSSVGQQVRSAGGTVDLLQARPESGWVAALTVPPIPMAGGGGGGERGLRLGTDTGGKSAPAPSKNQPAGPAGPPASGPASPGPPRPILRAEGRPSRPEPPARSADAPPAEAIEPRTVWIVLRGGPPSGEATRTPAARQRAAGREDR